MSESKKKTHQEKQDRLAEALRENLKRRKSQDRKNLGRKQTTPAKPAGKDS